MGVSNPRVLFQRGPIPCPDCDEPHLFVEYMDNGTVVLECTVCGHQSSYMITFRADGKVAQLRPLGD